MNYEPHQFLRIADKRTNRVWGVLVESGRLTTVPRELSQMEGWKLDDFKAFCRKCGYTIEKVSVGRRIGRKSKHHE